MFLLGALMFLVALMAPISSTSSPVLHQPNSNTQGYPVNNKNGQYQNQNFEQSLGERQTQYFSAAPVQQSKILSQLSSLVGPISITAGTVAFIYIVIIIVRCFLPASVGKNSIFDSIKDTNLAKDKVTKTTEKETKTTTEGGKEEKTRKRRSIVSEVSFVLKLDFFLNLT